MDLKLISKIHQGAEHSTPCEVLLGNSQIHAMVPALELGIKDANRINHRQEKITTVQDKKTRAVQGMPDNTFNKNHNVKVA